MTFAEALAALDARIIEHMVPDLDRIVALSDLLGNPQRNYPSIHVTGTNGKTTTAVAATQMLRAAGLSVGTYTSPHVDKVTERIAFDGTPITEAEFAEGYAYLEPFLHAVDQKGERVTWFETLTMLAENVFAEKPVDAAVFEVGMGGTWDATNLIDGRVAVIAPIALDHPELGSTPAEIAVEKAGIIKPDAVVISAAQDDDVMRVIERACVERNAELRVWGRDFDLESLVLAVGGQVLTIRIGSRTYEELFLPLFGSALARDAVLACAAVHAFLGDRELVGDLVAGALARVRSPGRLEVNRSPRATPLDQMKKAAAALGTPVDSVATVEGAVAVALEHATERDCVCVTGSLYTVGEARKSLFP
ncbi:MAG: dihydrofolate synthase [Actinobacteria bacterium]|nr:dihydrofolate synthase [Actinomycetota bacterium]